MLCSWLLQFTLPRNIHHRTTHNRNSLYTITAIVIPEKQQLAAAARAPPGNAEVGAVHVHFAVAQDFPEAVDAGGAEDWVGGFIIIAIAITIGGVGGRGSVHRVDQTRRQGEKVLEILHEEIRQGVDDGEDDAGLFGEERR